MRSLTIIGGMLMILTGVFCFINPGQTFLAFAFVVGVVMAVNGLIHIFAYLTGRGLHNKGDNNGWILIDALVTLILGVMILCNQVVADTVVPMVFGMWVLISGILRIEAATHINREKKLGNFRTTLISGIATTMIGIFGFINPLVAVITTTILVGVFMLIQGINVVELGIHMPHEKKSYVRIYKRKREPVIITEEEESPEKVAERIKAREEAAQAAEAEAVIIGVRNDDI